MTPVFGKRCFFEMGEKVGFTNCVFEKLCVFLKTLFYSVSEKHSSCKTNTVCKKQKIDEK